VTAEVALVQEQGVSFAVVLVKRQILDRGEAEKSQIAGDFSRRFGSVPVVLMVQDHKGTPIYWGRKDLVRWLSDVPFELLPWAKYSLN
jgi:hypothetical protein